MREIVRSDEMEWELPDLSTGETAFASLSARYPDLHPWKRSVRLAVNLEYASFTQGLADGDEVSFIPPVSGG